MIRCDHSAAVPVESGGEVVAALCPTCDVQLTAAWLTCDHASAYESSVDISSLAAPPGQRLCNGCGVTYWPPPRRIIPTIANLSPPTTAELIPLHLTFHPESPWR